jgi:hypothetical protein
LFFIAHASRRVWLAGCSTNPTGAWVTQQARNLGRVLADDGVRFLIRDRDGKYSGQFDGVFRSSGIRIVKTPVRAPQANAIAERFVSTVRVECLDWLLILNRRLKGANSRVAPFAGRAGRIAGVAFSLLYLSFRGLLGCSSAVVVAWTSRTSSSWFCVTSLRWCAGRSRVRGFALRIVPCSRRWPATCRAPRALRVWSARGRCCGGIGRSCAGSGGSHPAGADGRLRPLRCGPAVAVGSRQSAVGPSADQR